MRIRSFIGGFALGCVTLLGAATALQQDPPDPAAMEKMWQEAMEKYCTPSDEHKQYAKREGSWTFTAEHWMAPGEAGPPFEGTADFTMLLDGRYLGVHYRGDTPFGPFEGLGLNGFDRMKKKHVSMWVDNMSTAIMTTEGTATDEKTLEFTGLMPDPMSGTYVKHRSVERMVDDDTFIMEMYGPGPDGKEFMMMKLTHKRVK